MTSIIIWVRKTVCVGILFEEPHFSFNYGIFSHDEKNFMHIIKKIFRSVLIKKFIYPENLIHFIKLYLLITLKNMWK